MSNWFENNPTKSVIAYTMVVSGFTWAVSTFVLQENRVNLLKGEVDSQKAIADQYKSKVELLQREIDTVRAENLEYRNWASSTKDAIPAIVPKIIELKSKLTELETLPSATYKLISTKEITVSRGRAFIEPHTGLVVSLISVDVNRYARVSVKTPDKGVAQELNVYPGWQWKFKHKNLAYTLTLMETNFPGDLIKIQLTIDS